MSTVARDIGDDRPRTVGDVIARALWKYLDANVRMETTNACVPGVCADLGIDPAAPLANIVALTEGQKVVARRKAEVGEQCVNDASAQPWTVEKHRTTFPQWVVVRSAVPSPVNTTVPGLTADDTRQSARGTT